MNKKGAGGQWFTNILGFVVFIGLPAFWTAVAPVAVTHLTRENGRVIARTQNNMFFVIPYLHKSLDDVRDADDRIRAGDRIKKRYNDRQDRGRAEDQGFLVLSNGQEAIEAPVSPVNLSGVVQKVRDFLKDPSQQHLRLVTVANWKVSVIFPIPLVLLTLLYVVGVTVAFFRWVLRLQRPRSEISTPHLP